jgi:3-phenylpropionate/trans-cinnamate dioxygenase ferredoxin subunit
MPAAFTRVAAAAELAPGKMACVEVAGRRLLLANVDGAFYATDDTCTHEDASLCTGALKGEYVKCPLHGSRFSLLTGEPLEEPADEPLNTYAVKVEGGAILVANEPNPRQA